MANISSVSMLRYLAVLGLFTATPPLHAADWDACHSALEELTKVARAADEAASTAASARLELDETREQLRSCREYRYDQDPDLDECAFEESAVEGAESNFRSAVDDAEYRLRRLRTEVASAETACEAKLGLPTLSIPAAPCQPHTSAPLTAPPQPQAAPLPGFRRVLPPGCEAMARLARVFAGETLLEKCRERFAEAECQRCLASR